MRAGASTPALISKLISNGSCNCVEVAELNTGEEMMPFIHSKLTDWPVGLRGVPYNDELASTRDLYASAVIAGTGNPPIKIPNSRFIRRHGNFSFL
jgi:hypothetical protein